MLNGQEKLFTGQIKNINMKRSIKHPKSKKFICIKIANPEGQDMFDRVPRPSAANLIAKHDNVTYTSKSRYHKFLQKELR